MTSVVRGQLSVVCSHLHREMERSNLKEEARRLVDQMSENSTWDDLMHMIYVRQSIEKGLADSEAGRTTAVEEVRKQFGLEN